MLVPGVQTDISQVVIDHMRERHQQYSNMTYVMLSESPEHARVLQTARAELLDKRPVGQLLRQGLWLRKLCRQVQVH